MPVRCRWIACLALLGAFGCGNLISGSADSGHLLPDGGEVAADGGDVDGGMGGGGHDAGPPDSGTPVDAGSDGGGQDGGPDGGDSDGGEADAGYRDGGPNEHPDGGTGDGGHDGGPADGGTFTGDGGAFAWMPMGIPSGVRIVYGVGGTSPSDVYALGYDSPGSKAVLLHYDGNPGATWSPIVSVPFTTCEGLWVSPGGAVLLGCSHGVLYCDSGCTQAANYLEYRPGVYPYFDAVCGSATEMFAVSPNSSTLTADVYRRTGSGWSLFVQSIGVDSSDACHAADDGTLWVAGDGISRVLPDAGVVEERPTAGYAFWHALHQVDGVLFAAGASRTIAQRMPDGGWLDVYDPPGPSGSFHALAGRSIEEVFAAGDHHDPPDLARLDSAGWKGLTFPETAVLFGLWAADDNTYVAVGQLYNSNGDVEGGAIYYLWR